MKDKHYEDEYFEIPRTEGYEKTFHDFLERCGFDSYGHIDHVELQPFSTHTGFENGVFVLRPYYWGDDDRIADLPNFVYKPDNITISWYKYPMRGAYMNKALNEYEFFSMLCECEASLDGIYGGTKRYTERPETKDEYLARMRELEKEMEG